MMTLLGTCPPVFSRLSKLTELQWSSAHAVLLRRNSFSALASACIFHCPRGSCWTWCGHVRFWSLTQHVVLLKPPVEDPSLRLSQLASDRALMWIFALTATLHLRIFPGDLLEISQRCTRNTILWDCHFWFRASVFQLQESGIEQFANHRIRVLAWRARLLHLEGFPNPNT